MTYDKKKYKIWDWKSPWIIHWMINPGVAVVELLGGITIPKVMLIEREGDKPLYYRSWIPCPHCRTLHSGLKWSQQNKTAFKNWFGFYCDHCGKIIPVQRNLVTLLFLVVTYPLWGWFRKSLKQHWLDKQPARFINITLEVPEKVKTKKFWIRNGLTFGLVMYIFQTILSPLMQGDEINVRMLIIAAPIWFLFGLGFGYMNKSFITRKGKTPKKIQIPKSQ